MHRTAVEGGLEALPGLQASKSLVQEKKKGADEEGKTVEVAAAPQPVVVERSDSPDFVHVETTMTQSPAVHHSSLYPGLPYQGSPGNLPWALLSPSQLASIYDKEAAQLRYEMPETAENQAVDVGAEEPDAAAELETPDEKKNKKKKNKKKK